MKLNDLRKRWDAAGGGVQAALKLDNGKYLLPFWKGDHEDFCKKCDHGGNFFSSLLSHFLFYFSPYFPFIDLSLKTLFTSMLWYAAHTQQLYSTMYINI